MAKNNKYSSNIEQNGTKWKAQIIRQVTSKKTQVSSQRDDFSSEREAKEWAQQKLAEFTNTLEQSNSRHGERRKLNSEKSILRSERRAQKTLAKKQQQEKDKDT